MTESDRLSARERSRGSESDMKSRTDEMKEIAREKETETSVEEKVLQETTMIIGTTGIGSAMRNPPF